MDPKLVEFLKSGATLLTPTRRLAARMLSKANKLLSKQTKVWSTPLIFAIDDWFMAIWDQFEIQGRVNKQLLNNTQSLLLFEKIIEQSEKGKTLLQTHTTAKLAYDAWKILHLWEAKALLEKAPENIDEATFHEWADGYQAWLSTQECIDGAQLVSTIGATLRENTANEISAISPVKKLILYAFEEHAPLLNTFFQLLEEKGWEISHLQPLKITPLRLERQSFVNEEAECKAAACWAKALLKQNIKDIAIVTPHLTKQRNKIESILRDCLDPLMVCDSVLEVNRDFNISAAIPLIQYPIIEAAFTFLKLNHRYCALSDYLAALISPFSANGQSEAYARAKLSGVLKQRAQTKWSIDQGLSTLGEVNEQEVRGWKTICLSLKNIASRLSTQKTLLKWSEIFREILASVGWPGELSLSSIEHQAVKRFDELLNEFSSCDKVLAASSYEGALALLEKLCANVPFQAENKNAPIQILGLLEAAGQHFAHLWIMGLHSEAWPESSQPNPFIAIHFQRKLKMPHASPEREMRYAKKVTQRLKESAQEIIFSYPLQDKEKILAVSELIADLPVNQASHENLPTKFDASTFFQAHSTLEPFCDDLAPCVEKDENIIGNTSLLTLQSTCPFKAFAQIRLGTKPIEPKEIWLTPREQGTILHKILEIFWHQIKDSTTLHRLSSDEMESRLTQIIRESIQNLANEAPHIYIEVEIMRLQIILRDYIALEKQRVPFKILALESQKQLVLGELTFRLRIDRLDEDIHGDVIIIDYKTGQFQLNQLWGERPQAPQLPLYFLASQNAQPKALMITSLNSKKCEMMGISQEPDKIKGLETLDQIKHPKAPLNWEELASYWHCHLEKLVLDFQQGYAKVDPLQSKATCQFCQLSSICRIAEIRAAHE